MENNLSNQQPSNANELNKENQFYSLKRNCTNRHSLHQKLEYKHSLNKYTKPALLTSLSNSISSLPIVDHSAQQDFSRFRQDLVATSDGAMSTVNSRKLRDFNLIKTDNRLSPTSKNHFLIRTTAHSNDNNESSAFPANSNTLITNHDHNKPSTNGTATKRRASMVDNSMQGSGVSPTKSKF